ncbi:E3 ubiquitin-protein ligase bre-1 [Bienertia sinuspersici]
MKLEGRQSKLKICIPDDIDRAIRDNAHHFVNECGRVVRIRAPSKVKNWKEAFTMPGKLEVKECGSYMTSIGYGKLGYTITIRLWSDLVLKNSRKRTKNITRNLSFVEVEDILTQENQGVKPPADVIWLVEHTTRNNEGVLQWADESCYKEIHEQLKVVVAIHDLDIFVEKESPYVVQEQRIKDYKKRRKKLQNNYKRLRKEHQNN